jgi:glycine cleavage system aminomethyltransferase T
VDEHLVLGVATGSAAGEYAYLTGALHTVTGLVDAGGAAVVRYAYDAYGLPTTYAASTPCNPCDANCDGFVTPADIDFTGRRATLTPCPRIVGNSIKSRESGRQDSNLRPSAPHADTTRL